MPDTDSETDADGQRPGCRVASAPSVGQYTQLALDHFQKDRG
jgi:hypothetical protein